MYDDADDDAEDDEDDAESVSMFFDQFLVMFIHVSACSLFLIFFISVLYSVYRPDQFR